MKNILSSPKNIVHTPVSVDDLLSHLTYPKHRLMILLMSEGHLSASAVVALKRSDVLLQKHALKILFPVKGSAQSSSAITIPLSERLFLHLTSYLYTLASNASLYLFPNRSGDGHLWRSSLSSAISRLRKEQVIPVEVSLRTLVHALPEDAHSPSKATLHTASGAVAPPAASCRPSPPLYTPPPGPRPRPSIHPLSFTIAHARSLFHHAQLFVQQHPLPSFVLPPSCSFPFSSLGSVPVSNTPSTPSSVVSVSGAGGLQPYLPNNGEALADHPLTDHPEATSSAMSSAETSSSSSSSDSSVSSVLSGSSTAPTAIPMIGRDRELAELNQAIAKDIHVCVLGPAGTGKSLLLQQLSCSRKVLTFDSTVNLKGSLVNMLIFLYGNERKTVKNILCKDFDLQELQIRLSRESIAHLCEEIIQRVKPGQYILRITDLDSLSPRVSRAITLLKEHFLVVAAAREVPMPRSLPLSNFKIIKLANLKRKDSFELIASASAGMTIQDREAYRTHIYGQTDGNPRAILEMIDRYRKEPRLDNNTVVSVTHQAALPEYDMSYVVIFLIAAIAVMRYLTGELDNPGYRFIGGLAMILLILSRSFFSRTKRKFL